VDAQIFGSEAAHVPRGSSEVLWTGVQQRCCVCGAEEQLLQQRTRVTSVWRPRRRAAAAGATSRALAVPSPPTASLPSGACVVVWAAWLPLAPVPVRDARGEGRGVCDARKMRRHADEGFAGLAGGLHGVQEYRDDALHEAG
jgi:hypothetical protein